MSEKTSDHECYVCGEPLYYGDEVVIVFNGRYLQKQVGPIIVSHDACVTGEIEKLVKP